MAYLDGKTGLIRTLRRSIDPPLLALHDLGSSWGVGVLTVLEKVANRAQTPQVNAQLTLTNVTDIIKGNVASCEVSHAIETETEYEVVGSFDVLDGGKPATEDISNYIMQLPIMDHSPEGILNKFRLRLLNSDGVAAVRGYKSETNVSSTGFTITKSDAGWPDNLFNNGAIVRTNLGDYIVDSQTGNVITLTTEVGTGVTWIEIEDDEVVLEVEATFNGIDDISELLMVFNLVVEELANGESGTLTGDRITFTWADMTKINASSPPTSFEFADGIVRTVTQEMLESIRSYYIFVFISTNGTPPSPFDLTDEVRTNGTWYLLGIFEEAEAIIAGLDANQQLYFYVAASTANLDSDFMDYARYASQS